MLPELGSCYYPEHWPEDQWKSDAEQMVASGLTWVRIGEFAWSRIEPKEGEYNFQWLDHAISILGEAGFWGGGLINKVFTLISALMLHQMTPLILHGQTPSK